jgi:hypothetical protein
MRQRWVRFAAAVLFAVPSMSAQDAARDVPSEFTLDLGFLVPGVTGPEISFTSAAGPAAAQAGKCIQI